MSDALLVFALAFTLELLVWLSGQPWAQQRLLWSRKNAEIRALHKRRIELQRTLDATSATDTFAKWAKLQREITDLTKKIDALQEPAKRLGYRFGAPIVARAVAVLILAVLAYFYRGEDMAGLPQSLVFLGYPLSYGGSGVGYVGALAWITLSTLSARFIIWSMTKPALSL